MSTSSATVATPRTLRARCLVPGIASGAVLYSDTPISFWGGVDPATGMVIDQHHPLHGQSITGRILAIPAARGSCTGSSVLLELILNGHGPAALVFSREDTILTLGAIIAEEVFGKTLPAVTITPDDFVQLEHEGWASLSGDRLTLDRAAPSADTPTAHTFEPSGFNLNDTDNAILAGEHGEAARVAMRVTLRVAQLEGTRDLIDISQGHIDGCIYTGPASLHFAERLLAMGGRVKVPTTLNAISADERRWQKQGMDPALAVPAVALGHAYLGMGARPTYTCAPYQLETAPKRGEDIVWAESNAVVYANSVLGARTAKYPDFLDICIAITGRAPCSGCHIAEQRLATIQIEVEAIGDFDDLLYPLLGHHVGLLVDDQIPVITGFETARPSDDDLRAFSAAFATTSGAAMFHWVGATPEAATLAEAIGTTGKPRVITVTREALLASWHELNPSSQLNTSDETKIDLVSLGNPHFSFDECRSVSDLVKNRRKHDRVAVIITCGRHTFEQIKASGTLATLEEFGVQIANDVCWCMIEEPLLPPTTRAIVTNSAKYAHYGPGLVSRPISLRSLAECVEAACTGTLAPSPPRWLARA